MSKPSFLQQTLERIKSLHPSAEVIAEVSRMMSDPGVQLEDLAEVLRTDSALTGDIIRLSNSAIYGHSQKISTLREALARVGMKEVSKIISLSLSQQYFNKGLKNYGIDAREDWASAVLTALLMERFVDRMGGSVSTAYTVGMLHGVGRMVVNQMLDLVPPSVELKDSESEQSWEEDSAGINHAEAGARLLEMWNFPEIITVPIGEYLEPKAKERFLSVALNYASRLCHAYMNASQINEIELPESEWFKAYYDFEDKEIFQTLEDVKLMYEVIQDSLGMSNA